MLFKFVLADTWLLAVRVVIYCPHRITVIRSDHPDCLFLAELSQLMLDVAMSLAAIRKLRAIQMGHCYSWVRSVLFKSTCAGDSMPALTPSRFDRLTRKLPEYHQVLLSDSIPPGGSWETTRARCKDAHTR